MALVAAPASADVLAVFAVARPPGTAIVRVNAGTGAITQLYATNQLCHPSVSSDGTRIAWEVIFENNVVENVDDLGTGQEHFVVNQSGTAATAESSPAISPDGQTLLTGGRFAASPSVTLYSLATFPAGPFGVSTFQTQYSVPGGGYVYDPVKSGSLIAFVVVGSSEQGLVVGQLGGVASPLLRGDYFEPALGSPGGLPTLVFETFAGGRSLLASRPVLPLSDFPGPPQSLPFDTANAYDPAFTADGRYLGFVSGPPDHSDARLFVWDTQTQTMINPAGVDLGDAGVCGAAEPYELYGDKLSLFEHTVFGRTGITPAGDVNFRIAQDSAVGIFVQRVIGHHELFGRRVPRLKVVGHVPLGRFRPGRRHAHWNLKVNGRRLKPGTYQVTLRALTAAKQIREFAVPHLIRVRAPIHIHS